jgi:hypothetical protein
MATHVVYWGIVMSKWKIFLVAVLVIIVAIVAYRPIVMLIKKPPPFSFRYFEALSPDIVVVSAAAQKYVDERFPPGANIQQAMQEFSAAGATCSRETAPAGTAGEYIYYACGFRHQGLGLWPISWGIQMTPDHEEKTISKITITMDIDAP